MFDYTFYLSATHAPIPINVAVIIYTIYCILACRTAFSLACFVRRLYSSGFDYLYQHCIVRAEQRRTLQPANHRTRRSPTEQNIRVTDM